MKVLVACEESQRVCLELRKLGHESFSCDTIEPSGNYPQHHIQDDVLKHLDKGWDMMIAFPPCTDLAVSGARHFKKKRENGQQQKSIDFFMKLALAPIPKIAIENPIGIMSTQWRKPDQIIQPYMFGDPFQKSTCLWLKGLPKLKPTNIVDKGEFKTWIGKDGKKKRQAKWIYEQYGKKDMRKQRSKTFKGIAQAMAQQWG